MKHLKLLLLIIELIVIYIAILWVPTVTVQAIFQSETAYVNYTLFDGLAAKTIIKGKIIFSFDYKIIEVILIFLISTIATICISSKKGRTIGLCLYFVTLVLLALNVDINVFSIELQNESYEIHEKTSLFLLVHPCLYIISYVLQGIVLKIENTHSHNLT